MTVSREDVLSYFMEVLQSMGDEWEDASSVTEDSLIMGNLNWRSIEIVYLANAMQRKYGRKFPFEQWLKTIEQRETKDVTVREWVDFIHSNLDDASDSREPVNVGEPGVSHA